VDSSEEGSDNDPGATNLDRHPYTTGTAPMEAPATPQCIELPGRGIAIRANVICLHGNSDCINDMTIKSVQHTKSASRYK
jgi:hypothetical protein